MALRDTGHAVMVDTGVPSAVMNKYQSGAGR